MEYVNPRNGKKIDLSGLNEKELEFYKQALQKFENNEDWIEFDNFVFGTKSPVYNSGLEDPITTPLYLALEDMLLQLGVQQGEVSEEN